MAGQTPKSITAFANVKKICEDHLAGKYRIDVIDLLKNPQLAKGAQIVAIPTLVRKLPEPLKKLSEIWLIQNACWWDSTFVLSEKDKSEVRSQNEDAGEEI